MEESTDGSSKVPTSSSPSLNIDIARIGGKRMQVERGEEAEESGGEIEVAERTTGEERERKKQKKDSIESSEDKLMTLEGRAEVAGSQLNNILFDKEEKSKKRRLVWTKELHDLFVLAVNMLGVKNASPKTIMKLMRVEGLTTEHIKSHLQKYRLSLKKNSKDGGGDVGTEDSCSSTGKKQIPSSPTPPMTSYSFQTTTPASSVSFTTPTVEFKEQKGEEKETEKKRSTHRTVTTTSTTTSAEASTRETTKYVSTNADPAELVSALQNVPFPEGVGESSGAFSGANSQHSSAPQPPPPLFLPQQQMYSHDTNSFPSSPYASNMPNHLRVDEIDPKILSFFRELCNRMGFNGADDFQVNLVMAGYKIGYTTAIQEIRGKL